MTSSAGFAPPAALTVPQKAALVLEILGLYLRVRKLLRTRSLPEALNALRGPRIRPRIDDREAARLGVAVRRTLACLPTDARCLTQALVLTALLARRGTDVRLVIGVRSSNGFGAHAWVERGRRPLLPPLEHEFRRLAEL